MMLHGFCMNFTKMLKGFLLGHLYREPLYREPLYRSLSTGSFSIGSLSIVSLSIRSLSIASLSVSKGFELFLKVSDVEGFLYVFINKNQTARKKLQN